MNPIRKPSAKPASGSAVAALLASWMIVHPALAADTANGGRLYATYCVGCHGPTGQSVMPGAPNFSRGERLLQPDMTLIPSIKMGRNAMPAFQGILKDHEILDIIAHLRTLSR